jgi:hypothetical protein
MCYHVSRADLNKHVATWGVLRSQAGSLPDSNAPMTAALSGAFANYPPVAGRACWLRRRTGTQPPQ